MYLCESCFVICGGDFLYFGGVTTAKYLVSL